MLNGKNSALQDLHRPSRMLGRRITADFDWSAYSLHYRE